MIQQIFSHAINEYLSNVSRCGVMPFGDRKVINIKQNPTMQFGALW